LLPFFLVAKKQELSRLIEDPLFHELFWEEHKKLFPAAFSFQIAGIFYKMKVGVA
jgi:hypothetical protein